MSLHPEAVPDRRGRCPRCLPSVGKERAAQSGETPLPTLLGQPTRIPAAASREEARRWLTARWDRAQICSARHEEGDNGSGAPVSHRWEACHAGGCWQAGSIFGHLVCVALF